ncbi:MAG TPA: hypothetical protein VGI63_10060 [Verrucomicrobiae bacterium]
MISTNHNRIFVWENYADWRRTAIRLLGDFLDKSVLDELKQNPPKYFVSDNLSWLDKAMLEQIAEKYCVRPYRQAIIGFGFSIEEKLQPENIVQFHFPTSIPNPHNYRVRED